MDKLEIRALILDYGGVISEPQKAANVKNMCRSLKREYNDFLELYRERRPPYDSGAISGHEYWKRILAHCGIEADRSLISRLIREDVKSWTIINPSMLEFIKKSRSRVEKLAIVSNMTKETLVFLKQNFKWLALFDARIYSCEIGRNKPHREIYEACRKKLKTAPGQCLFVDDSLENVKGALNSGMNAVQFKNFRDFMHQLDKKYCLTIST